VLVALGLLAALAYGSADFAGGLAARRAPAVTVVLWSQLVGVLVLVVALLAAPAEQVGASDLAWGAAAGLFGGTGMALLYAGLASGVVSVVSPVTAVTAAVVPVVGGLALGETMSGPAAIGVALGVGAVAMLSFARGSVAEHHTPEQVRRAVLAALGAGSSFGAFFLLVDRTDSAAGLWPLLSARAASIPLMVVAALVLRRGFRLRGRTTFRLVVAAGAVDMVANISFLLATREGSVAIVAVLVALAPAATLGLARMVLHERVRRLQAVGLAVGAAAVVLIALG
jgi:drug/metabolite transporter (DMT)-like permease